MIREKHTEWAKYINFVEDCLNNSVHETTGFNPIEIYKKQKPTRFWDTYFKDFTQGEDEPYSEKIRLCRERIINKAAKRAEKYNEKHKVTKFKVNDLILIKANNVSSAIDRSIAKFFAIYKDPFLISKVYNNNTYAIENSSKKKIGTFHVKDLRRYYARVEGDQAGPAESKTGGEGKKKERKK